MGKYLKKFDTHEEYEEYISDYGVKEVATEIKKGSFATYEDYDGHFRDMPFVFEGKIIVPYQTEQIIIADKFDYYRDRTVEYWPVIANMAMFLYWYGAILVSSDSVTGDTYEIFGWENSYRKDYTQIFPIEKGKEVNNLIYDHEDCPDGGYIYFDESDFPLCYDKVTYLETKEVANFHIPNVSICMDELADIHHVHYMPEFKKPLSFSGQPIDIGHNGVFWSSLNIGAKDEFDPGLFFNFAGKTGYETFEKGNNFNTPYFDFDNDEWTKYFGSSIWELEDMDDVCLDLPPVEIDGKTYYWHTPTMADYYDLFQEAENIEMLTDEQDRFALQLTFSDGNSILFPFAQNPASDDLDVNVMEYMTDAALNGSILVSRIWFGSAFWCDEFGQSRHLVFPVRPVIYTQGQSEIN